MNDDLKQEPGAGGGQPGQEKQPGGAGAGKAPAGDSGTTAGAGAGIPPGTPGGNGSKDEPIWGS